MHNPLTSRPYMSKFTEYAILYHSDWDGLTAAWIAQKYLKHIKHSEDYILVPVEYGQPFPLDLPQEYGTIYILDFSYDRETIEEILKATKLILLDHHTSAQRALEGLPGCIFNTTMSGALLTWKHFFGANPPPHLVSYVEDYDTWKFKLPKSHLITNAIYSHPLNLMSCNLLDKLFSSKEGFDQLLIEGQAIQRQKNLIIDTALKQKHTIWIGDYLVPACNWPILVSEIAGTLSGEGNYPFGCCYHYDGKSNLWKYSVRTNKDNVDLSKLCAGFGGGGHPRAAGFHLSTSPFITNDNPRR